MISGKGGTGNTSITAGGLSKEHMHCAMLAVNALQKAVENHHKENKC